MELSKEYTGHHPRCTTVRYAGSDGTPRGPISVCHIDCKLQLANILSSQLEKAQARIGEMEKQYHELIMAVGSKFPGETRHQTALKYIQRAAQITCREPAQQALTPARAQP